MSSYNEMDRQEDRALAVAWATKHLTESAAVILDTKTSGLDDRAEICQIAIITMRGQVLLDTLVKPSRPIPPSATRIHHITDAMVADAPTIADLLPQLREILGGSTVVIYNADYDTRVLEQSLRRAGVESYEFPLFGAFAYVCAMEAYAAYVGEWNSYHGNYRYQRLLGGDHTALGDCRATLAVLQRMAGQGKERPT